MNEGKVYRPVIPSRTRQLELRGVRHHITEWGDSEAPPLVCLHGWGDCGATFQFLVDALKSDLHVIAPDFRGFGRSEWTGPAYWFPDYLADLDALLGSVNGDEPLLMLGHSMGGNVASLFAGVFPERVRALINLEGVGLPDSNPDDAPAHYRRFVVDSRRSPRFTSYDSFAELAARIRSRNPRTSEARAEFAAREWGVLQADHQVALRMDPAHRRPNAVQYRRAEAEACWRAASAPTLLVYGEETSFLDSAPFAAWQSGADDAVGFPNARIAAVADAGHMLHFDNPAGLAERIDDFLAQAVDPL